MRWGLTTSLVLHGAILAAALVVLPRPEPFKVTPQDAIEVDISKIEDVSKRQATVKAAEKSIEKPAPKKTEEVKKTEPAPKPAEEVKKAAKEPEAAPPKPEAKKEQPKKEEPKPLDTAALADTLKTIEEKPAEKKPEEKKPEKKAEKKPGRNSIWTRSQLSQQDRREKAAPEQPSESLRSRRARPIFGYGRPAGRRLRRGAGAAHRNAGPCRPARARPRSWSRCASA
jgi:hypothetical protein